MAWIQLLSIQHFEKAGISRTYYPGDWIDIGLQSAQRLVTDGLARFATPQKLGAVLAGCGMVLSGTPAGANKLRAAYPTLAIAPAGANGLPYARTLFWDADLPLRPELVRVGFGLLSTWEVAVPLASYQELAAHVGTPGARERTAAVVRDLRVPLYEPRLVFVRRCRSGEALLDAWQSERDSGDEPRLCLLRALYTVKPLVCALPVSWITKSA